MFTDWDKLVSADKNNDKNNNSPSSCKHCDEQSFKLASPGILKYEANAYSFNKHTAIKPTISKTTATQKHDVKLKIIFNIGGRY